MKDKDGEEINAGDKFTYNTGQAHVTGEIFDCGGVAVIKWEDGNDIISVEDFYYPPTDQKLLKKL